MLPDDMVCLSEGLSLPVGARSRGLVSAVDLIPKEHELKRLQPRCRQGEAKLGAHDKHSRHDLDQKLGRYDAAEGV